MSFACDIIAHPIDTATEVGRAFVFLSKLVYSQEWEMLAQTLAPEVCELISKWDTISSGEQGDLAGYAFGKYGSDILIPGASAKVVSKGAKELTTACRALKNAEQVLALEGLTQSSGKAHSVFIEGGVLSFEEARLKSIALHKKARDTLKLYVKKPMSENQVRSYIHETGIPTFPRPKGIPKNYIVRITDRGAGMEYVDPTNAHISVRVMPGKSHSPHIHQQNPYVIQMKDGKAFDKCGNLIPHECIEAHIPLNEYIYRE